MIENIAGNHQGINLVGKDQRSDLVKNPCLFKLARPTRQFMPDMPVRCMQDFYKTASFDTTPRRKCLGQIAFTPNHFRCYFCSIFGANKFENIQIYPVFISLKLEQNCSADSDRE